MMKTAFGRWLSALIACAIVTIVSIVYIDRPAAQFLEAHFRHTAYWMWLHHALSPIPLFVVLALFFLLGSGTWLLAGRRLAAWTLTPILCSWSVMLALGAETVLKAIFGRGWPDPTYLERHQYGFHFLHGTLYWNSFPSGTAMIAATVAAVLWITVPRWRAAGVVLAVALSLAVVAINGHWISDVVAGGFLGATIGWMTILLLRPDRLRVAVQSGPRRSFDLSGSASDANSRFFELCLAQQAVPDASQDDGFFYNES